MPQDNGEWIALFNHPQCRSRKLTHLSIRCSPDGVSTTPLISPGLSAKATSSNSFCMSPWPKNPLYQNNVSIIQDPLEYGYPFRVSFAIGITLPVLSSKRWRWMHLGPWAIEKRFTHRSPFFFALLQSDSVVASSPSVVSPLLNRASCPRIISIDSSFDLVISASRQLDGRRLPLCLTNRCAARILPSVLVPPKPPPPPPPPLPRDSRYWLM